MSIAEKIKKIDSNIKYLKELLQLAENNMVSGLATGESITVNDSAEWKGSIEVAGNNKQETRDNKNFAKFRIGQPTNRYGGVVYFDETSPIVFKANTKYTFSFDTENNGMGVYRQSLGLTWNAYSVICDGTRKSFTATVGNSDVTIAGNSSILLRDSASSDVPLTGITNVMIEIGDKATEYQPYGVMPSPEYPSEVETVGKPYNVLPFPYTHTTKTENGITWDVREDGSIKVSGTATGASLFQLYNNPTTKIGENNTDYFLSIGVKTTSIYASFFSNNNGTLTRFKSDTNFANDIQYTNPNNNNGVLIRLGVASGVTINEVIYPQISTQIKPYQQYGKGNVTVETSNKNEINYLEWEQGNFYVTGSQTGDNVDSQAVIRSKGYRTVLPNETYTLSCKENIGQLGYIYKDANGNKTGNMLTVNDTKYTFTTPSNAVSVRLRIGNSSYPKTYGNDYKLQLEKGNTKTTYVAHKGETITLPLQKEMLTGDSFEKLGGVWKEKHSWGKVVLDGTENWNTFKIEDSGLGRAMLTLSNVYYNTNEATVLCDKLLGLKFTNSWNVKEDCVSAYSQNRLIMYLNNVANLSAFKTWLSQYTPTIYYKLAVPEYLDCTPEQFEILEQLEKIKTYKNVTHVNNDSIAIMTLDYKKDIESLIK